MNSRRRAPGLRHKLIPGSLLRKRHRNGWPFHRYVEQLDEWLFDKGYSYSRTLEELAKILPRNRRAPKMRALSNWYHIRLRERWAEKIIRTSQTAGEYEQVAKANPGPITETLEKMINVAAFGAAEDPRAVDLDTVRTLTMLVTRFKELSIQERELALKERRIVLLEKKAEQADRTRDLMTDGTLTPEQREARIREVLGLPPAPSRPAGRA
jgi:hypothetical protein